ncbi:ABC transporter G family member 1-like [Tripterygium wilfordii]|uniref:ABC transporter G family member 1-like n=1 Tax=Tripterygium wilfordii TaxID=458696 RepID=UPI0018F842CB|nr:ABC transporter G family member 1-like [Tripterygium wilfordii]
MASYEHYPTSEPANLEIESTLQVETINYPLPAITNPNKEDAFLTWTDLWVKSTLLDALAGLSQLHMLTRRSFVNMNRDLGYYWLRFVIYIGLDVGLGIIFYNLGSSYGSIRARGSFLMFTSSLLTFMINGGFPSFVEDMKVFLQERLNGHYGVTAFVVGNTIPSSPYLIVISAMPGAIASIVFNFLMGIIAGAGIQGLMIFTGGFFRLPDDLPEPIWKYPLFYISFHKYAYQGLFKNEFEGLEFPGNNQAG